MKAWIIAVGSELLTPFRVDTNSLLITDRLNAIGIDVLQKSVIGDDVDRARRARDRGPRGCRTSWSAREGSDRRLTT